MYMEAVLGMAVDQYVLEWTVKSWETISDLCCTKLAANWKKIVKKYQGVIVFS